MRSCKGIRAANGGPSAWDALIATPYNDEKQVPRRARDDNFLAWRICVGARDPSRFRASSPRALRKAKATRSCKSIRAANGAPSAWDAFIATPYNGEKQVPRWARDDKFF